MVSLLESSIQWIRIARSRLRAVLVLARGVEIHRKVSIGPRCMIERPRCLFLGYRVELEQDVYLKVVADSARLHIGSCSFLGKGVEIDCQEKISIGKHVLLAPGCFITDHNHDMAADKRIDQQRCVSAPVAIEDDVWVGANAVILPGVNIGQGAVVGAGAVVTHDVEPFTVVGGVPARMIAKRK